ncbi:MAG TPA: 4Fe-4S binding protein [Verrucomicrobiae bacterium]|nr:4Fe-4S binding protein [Verrucomicrobiae bacterium]
MNIITVRRISQIFFLALFLWFCLVSSFGENWWQLRGWPVNWFLQLDPLVALGTVLTTRTLYAGLAWAGVTIALTVLLGRFFCGWLCPFGTIHQFFGWVGRRKKKFAERVAANQYRPAQTIKYYLLIGLLTSAAGSIFADLFAVARRWPVIPGLVFAIGLVTLSFLAIRKVVSNLNRALITLAALVVGWLVLAKSLRTETWFATSLQSGWLDPIPLVHRSVNLVLLPVADRALGALSASPRFYVGAWTIGVVFLAAVLLNFVIPRFYCRFVCPLGALFGVLSGPALWRVGKREGECTNCELCENDCEGACEPFEKIRSSECLLCMNCLDACRQTQMTYSTERSAAGEVPGPSLSRRGFIISAASGVAAVPMMRLSGLLGTNWQPRLVRPPGALGEAEFVERCLKCGQCMRVCPTNVIQPATTEAGLEGVWTPVLNFRAGTSGCQLNCVACGHICPTAAIRPLTLDEKLGRNQFASAGPIRMGLAFVDRNRCLPWAMEKPCIVCQENCPVSPKAIYLHEEFITVRDGVLAVRSATGTSVELDGAALTPGRFATGDYFCKPANGDDSDRRKIVESTANSVTIDPATPWSTAQPSGSRVEIQVRLLQPSVDPQLCIGCGICEHECPVSGLRAIRVTAENETRDRRHALLL